MLLLLLSRQLRDRVGEVPSLGKFLVRLEILLLDLIAMGLFYGLSERAKFNDCVWMVWQTITTVGYGDIPPKSAVGRYGIMVTGLIAILLITYVVSALVDYREALSQRRRMGMETNEEKGSTLLVCCRDEEEMETFIRELRCVRPNAPVCIVDDQMTELPARITHLAPASGSCAAPSSARRLTRGRGLQRARRSCCSRTSRAWTPPTPPRRRWPPSPSGWRPPCPSSTFW